MKTVAMAMAQTLRRAKVPYIFGYPGGEVVEFMNAAKDVGMPFLLTKHENTAAFAAGITGEITGIPGVCVATIGPGATNMATGIASAWMDRDPVIAITGQITSPRYNTSTHQVMDSVAFFNPITKWSAVIDAGSVEETMHKAIRVASSERPGPVHLALPSNLAKAEAGGKSPTTPPVRGFEGYGMPCPKAMEKAEQLITKAQRPVIAAGIGILRSGAGQSLVKLAEKLGVPVIVGPKAKGVIPENHPLFAGVFEMLGDRVVLALGNKADLIIACGFDTVEFDKSWDFTAPVVHIDSLANTDEFYQAEVELVGYLPDALAALAEKLPARTAWGLDELAKHRQELYALITRKVDGLASWQVIAAARKILPQETMAACDVGAHKFLVGQLWQTYSPKSFFMSNGLSGMGYGFPAAMAAQLAFPDRPVVAFLGDGGFSMYMAELETVKRLGLPLIIVVLCDQTLSLIAMSQERRGLPHNGVFFNNPDMVKVAEAFGIAGKACTSVGQVEAAISGALASRQPTLIQAMVDPAPYRI